MKRVYTKVQFDPNNNRKTKPSKSGKYPIYVMIKELRRKERIALDIPKVEINDFQDIEGKWVKKSVPNSRTINNHISTVITRIDEYILNIAVQGKRITPKEVKLWYLKTYDQENFMRQKKELLFDEFLEDYIIKERKGESYPTVLSKIRAFNRPAVFSDIDRDYFKAFSNFLKFDEVNKVHQTSGQLYFNLLKTVYREWCRVLDVDFHSKYFDGIKFENKSKTKKNALSWSELKKLENMKFGEGRREEKKEAVRDIFVFMCYTSRYYKEIKPLTFENNFFLEGHNKDKPVIKGQRIKTKEFFNNPLFPEIVRQIFYKHNPDKTGPFFPNINFAFSTASLNRYLKAFSEDLGLNFKMTTKTGRRTYATTISERFPKKLIKDVMGQKNINTQDIYVVKTSDSVFHEVERHWDKE